MKLKELAKKGGIESIIGIIILVALVIILIIAFVVPMIQSANEQGEETKGDVESAYSAVDEIRRNNADINIVHGGGEGDEEG